MTISHLQLTKVMEQGETYGGWYDKQRPNPKNDFLFKKLFSQEKSKPQLISLLNSILCRNGQVPIADVAIRNNLELTRDQLGDKESRIDLLCETDRNELVNVEMQVRYVQRMDYRSLFYLGKIFADSIGQGQPFSELKRTVAINILDHDYLPVTHYHSMFHMYEDRQRDVMLTDVLEMHFLECRKFLKVPFNLQDPLHRWLRFLDRRATHEQLKELMAMDAHIKSAEDILYELMGDPEVRERYWQRRMAEHERATWQAELESARKEARATAREEGREEGLQEGREEGREEGRQEGREVGREEGKLKVKQEIALSMLRENMDIALIEKFTGLNLSQIEGLREKH